MDGTAISQPSNMEKLASFQPQPRPYLPELFDYCFKTFATVSIWTGAHRCWYDYVYSTIFQHVLPSGQQFYRVITAEEHSHPVKPLSHLYDSSTTTPPFTCDNTLVVDNSDRTYILNPDNAIPIRTYDDNSVINGDIELMKLTYFFDEVVKHYQTHASILNLEKRNWSDYISNKLQLTGSLFDD